MSEESSKVKITVGVLFSPKDLTVEVEGDADKITSDLEAQLAGEAKSVTFDNGEGKRIVVPIDKLCYVEVDAGKKSSSIGFSF